jgi:uncharacterized protein (TIGR04255 family)
MLATPRSEEFFMRFGGRVAADGYTLVERLLPSGLPSLPFQPLYRFRKAGPEDGTTLYQLGAGLFSANITPPYHTWKHFRPVVERGIGHLIEARDEAERQLPFQQVSLRYIDAFRGNLLAGRSAADFKREVLGFNLTLPDAVSSIASKAQEPSETIQTSFPVQGGRHMQLTLGDGTFENQPAVILDTTIVSTAETAPAITTVMKAYDEAHGLIWEAFSKMTTKLSDLMEPMQ